MKRYTIHCPLCLFHRFLTSSFLLLFCLACSEGNKKQSPAAANGFINTRSQQDFSTIAGGFLKNAEYDSAYKYFSLALRSLEARKEWEAYIRTLLKMTDTQRSKGNIDKARQLADTAETILDRHLSSNRQLLADIRHKQGVLSIDRGQFDQAISLLNESIEIRIAASGSEDTLLAMTYNGLGNLFFFKGDYDGALSSYTRAYELALKRKIPEDADLAMFIQNTGIIYAQKGDYEKAETAFANSLRINERIMAQDAPDLAMLYLNMGRLLILAYKDNEALEYYDRAEEILLKKVGLNHPDLAGIYLNKGQIYVHMADYEKALIFFNKVLAIATENFGPGHPMILSANMNIGYIHEKKGDFENALKYYLASIPENDNNPSAIKTFSNLASLYNAMDDTEKAADYYNRAIDLAVKLLGPDHPETGLLYTRYGYFQLNEARGDLGIGMFRKALSISETHYGPASREVSNNLTHIGNFYLINNRPDKALQFYQNAIIAIVPGFTNTSPYSNPSPDQLIPDRYLINTLNAKADALYLQASANADEKMLELSLGTYKLSVKVVDKLRSSYLNEESKFLLSGDERNSYLNTVKVATRLYQLTGNKGYLEEGFLYSDKGKSTVLLSSMQDVEARHYGGVPRAVQDHEKKLRLDLGSYNRFIYEERQKASPDSRKIKFWEEKVFELETSYDSLVRILEENYPDYYSLKYREPVLDLENIRKNLDKDRALIEYALTDTVLYIFVLNHDRFEVVTRAVDKKFFSNIRALTSSTSAGDLMSISKKDYISYTGAAYSLFNDLIEPVKHITDKKKLIIIPDAEISFISFDMLLNAPPDTLGMDFRKLPFLIYDYIINYSASAILQFNKLNRSEKKPTRNLLAMAPSYDNLTNLETDGFTDESGNTVYLLPIPGVENEIREIRKVLSGSAFTGKDATEHAFKQRASKYNILHFAMHTLINNEKPMLSKLVFYQDGDSIEDGMLNTYELFGMELNANLAVLSACNTGSGKLMKGEGVMNLARGFIYAGVPGIVMTMWSVEDQASAQIVNSFYRYLNKGLPKDEALRQAKLDMLAEGDLLRSHPYYWAAYVTIGDYHPITLIRPVWLNILYVLILIISTGALIRLLIRRFRQQGSSVGR